MADRLDEILARRKGQVKTTPLLDCERVPQWQERGGQQTFHKYQLEAWNAEERFIFAIAGTRGGKTRLGAHWLLREIARTAVAGEDNHYLMVGPDTKLLARAAIPTLSRLLRAGRPDGWAHYRQNEGCYTFTDDGSRAICGFVCDIKIFVGYATKPESLEAATYKAVWADESGQPDFVRESWEAIRRRTGIDQARVIFTTTPYTFGGWLKELCDRADTDKSFSGKVVRFKTIANPLFPKEEWEAAKDLPPWKFKMFYEGEFTRPAGAIYDCFSHENNVVEPFPIPKSGTIHGGLDFGDVNTAAVCLYEDTDGTLYVYNDYHTGGRTADEHTSAIKKKSGGDFSTVVGGTWTGEDPAWRKEFIMAGLEVARPPIKEVEAGIDRVYRQIKIGRLKFFSDCTRTISEIESYAREIDDNNEPTQEIADKHKYHLADALRYIVATLRPLDDDSKPIDRLKSNKPASKPKEEDKELFERNSRIIEEEEKEDGKKVGLSMRRVV